MAKGKLRLHRRLNPALAAPRPAPRPAPAVPRPPLPADLPVAASSSTGKVCRCCKEAKPYGDYPPGKRTCLACVEQGLRPVYDRVCRVCGNGFQSYSQRAEYCCDEHFRLGVNETRRVRYANSD